MNDRGTLIGRMLTEATPNGETPVTVAGVRRSRPDANGLVTVLAMQQVGETKYLDAAGYPGRTVGLARSAFTPAYFGPQK
jgi:hypothetical protein